MSNSSIVPMRLEMELNACLALYFTETSKFSTSYWPRSLKLFLSEILTSAFLNFTGFDPHLAVDKTCIPNLVSEMAKPTSTYIHVGDRKTIGSLLRTIKMHYKSCHFIGISPHLVEASVPIPIKSEGSDPAWPGDLCSYKDLAASLTKPTIRRDVTKYVHCLVKRCIGSSGFKVSYKVPDLDPDDRCFYPITVHLNNALLVEDLKTLIVNESNTMEIKAHKNLTPEDLITVVLSDQRFRLMAEKGH